MLPRSRRLSVDQVTTVIKKGRVAHSPLFSIRYLTQAQDIRISAIVPRKIAPTAVERSSIRRMVYHALEALIKDISQHIHIVLTAKETARTTSTHQIEADLKTVFVKIGILR